MKLCSDLLICNDYLKIKTDQIGTAYELRKVLVQVANNQQRIESFELFLVFYCLYVD